MAGIMTTTFWQIVHRRHGMLPVLRHQLDRHQRTIAYGNCAFIVATIIMCLQLYVCIQGTKNISIREGEKNLAQHTHAITPILRWILMRWLLGRSLLYGEVEGCWVEST